jgi:hypothetical protein
MSNRTDNIAASPCIKTKHGIYRSHELILGDEMYYMGIDTYNYRVDSVPLLP